MTKVSKEDINAAVSAKKAESVKADFNDKKPEETKFNVDVQPLKGKIIDLSGKKLKSNFTVVRNGQAITFKKGMPFDDIPNEYKVGPNKILFKESHFE
ncbi:hypothetical protein Emin_0947 [Elusimicrobium minutum Pei191]|uniref:Uncharacterized protein n=1 Tax=Elusimicrobium minutum (strain Pei191) TaxID=445932 RepID=B2KDA4_ELUMP|nr:hypothetical protein [Elusimicrobium minutum]ACC98500.1 hypothetical protein Emin_0947 [Elusimicrobium minutum Pei191]